MRKFEYKIMTAWDDTYEDAKMLNEYGSSGWELVGISCKVVTRYAVDGQTTIKYIFKREILPRN